MGPSPPPPPGYGGNYYQQQGQHGAPQGMNQYGGRGPAVEVEGTNRSKAQLIVGIDFVGAVAVFEAA